MDRKSIIYNIIEDNGVELSDKTIMKEIDSIQYISIVVEIEQTFSTVLPDHLLSIGDFNNIDQFVSAVIDVLENDASQHMRNND